MKALEGTSALAGLCPVEQKTGSFLRQQSFSTRLEELESLGFRSPMGVSATETKKESCIDSTWSNIKPSEGSCVEPQSDAAAPSCAMGDLDIARREASAVKYRVSHNSASSGGSPGSRSGVTGLRMARRDSVEKGNKPPTQAAWCGDSVPVDLSSSTTEQHPQGVTSGNSESLYFVILFVDGVTIVEPTLEGVPFSFRLNWVSGADGRRVVSPLYQFKGNVEAYGALNGRQRTGADVELDKRLQQHVNTFPPAEWCTYLEGSMVYQGFREVSDPDGLCGELVASQGQAKIHLLLTYEETEETLALASFSLGQLGTSDVFRRFRLDLLTTAGPFATVTIFAACQRRWIKLGQEIFERRLEAGGVHIVEFLDVEKDEQARFVQQFISREIDLVRQAFASPSRDDEEARSLKEPAGAHGVGYEDSESDEESAKCSSQSNESPAAPSSPSSTYSPRGSTTVPGITLHRISEEQEEEEDDKEEAGSLPYRQDVNEGTAVREELITEKASAGDVLPVAKTNHPEGALGRGCGFRGFEEQGLRASEEPFRKEDVYQQSYCLGRRVEECHLESKDSRFIFGETQVQSLLLQGATPSVVESAEKNYSSKFGYRDSYFSEDVSSRLTTAGAIGDGSVIASMTVTDHPETTQDAGEVSAFSQTEPDAEHLEGRQKSLEGNGGSAEEKERFSEGFIDEGLCVSESCNAQSHAASSRICTEVTASDSCDQQGPVRPLALGMPEKTSRTSSGQRLSPTGEALIRALKELRASVSMDALGTSNPSKSNSLLNMSKMQTLWLLRDAVALCVKLCEEVVLSDVPSEEKKEAGGYLKVFQYVSQLCHVVSELRGGCERKDASEKQVAGNALSGETAEAKAVAMQGKEALVGLTRSLCLEAAKGEMPFQSRIEGDQKQCGMKVSAAEVQRKAGSLPFNKVSEASRTRSSQVKDTFCEDELGCDAGGEGVVDSGPPCEATESEASLVSESYVEPYVREEEKRVDADGTDNYMYGWQCEDFHNQSVKYGRRAAGPPLQARWSSMKREAGRDLVVSQSRANARLARMKMQELEALRRRKEIDDPLQRAHELNEFFRREGSKGLLPAEVQRTSSEASHKDVGHINSECHIGEKRIDLAHDNPDWRRASVRGDNSSAPVVKKTWNTKGDEELLPNSQEETDDDQREQRSAQGDSERSSLVETGSRTACVRSEQHDNVEASHFQGWPTQSSGWKANASGPTVSLVVRDSSVLTNTRSVGAARFGNSSTQNKKEMLNSQPRLSHSPSLQEFTSMQDVEGDEEESGMSQNMGSRNCIRVPADRLHQQGTERPKISKMILQEEIRPDSNRVTTREAAHEVMSGHEKAVTTVSGETVAADYRQAPSSVVYRRLPLKATVDGPRNRLQRLPTHLSHGYPEAGRKTYESAQRHTSLQGLQRSASFYPPPLPETGHQSLLLQSCHSYAESRHPSTAANGAVAAPPPLREPSQPDRRLRCPPSPMRAFSKDYVPSFHLPPPLNGPVSAAEKSNCAVKQAGLYDTQRPPIPGIRGKAFDVVQQSNPATLDLSKHKSLLVEERSTTENKGSRVSPKRPKVTRPLNSLQHPHQFANVTKNHEPPPKNPFDVEAHFEGVSGDAVLRGAHFEGASRASVAKDASCLRHLRRDGPPHPSSFPPRVHQGHERQAIYLGARASNPFSSVI